MSPLNCTLSIKPKHLHPQGFNAETRLNPRSSRLDSLARYWRNLAFSLFFISCLLFTANPASAYEVSDNAIWHGQQGQVLMETGHVAEAVEEYKAAIRLNPFTAMAAPLYNDLGLAYQAMGNYPLAFVSFQHAVRIQPNYALYYKNLIETYAVANRLPEVEAALKSALKRNPHDAEAWFMLGLLYQECKDVKASKACFARFLKLEPDSDLARAARAAL